MTVTLVVVGVLFALFLGVEAWALSRSSANRDNAWTKMLKEEDLPL